MKAPPYPIAGIPAQCPGGGGGSSVFDTPEALQINTARLQHLDSLGLPLANTSVLDLGCGVGHLARFFVDKGCKVTCVDGRAENIDEVRRRLPSAEAYVGDVQTDRLSRFGRFPVVLCYGLLYHLENPAAALRNMASACDGILLLETVISDHELPVVRLLDEPRLTTNQALSGLGCRPTPAFVAMALTRAGFDFVYAPRFAPEHPDFQFEWLNNLDCARNDHLLRCVFVASRKPLDNPNLTLLLSAPAHPVAAFTGVAPLAGSERVWIDVGAHLGAKTLPAAQADPLLRVYAFEPNLTAASGLMGKLANFVALPFAVAEKDGAAEFFVNEFEAASSLLPFVPEGLSSWLGGEQLRVRETRIVPTIRLDTFMDGAGIGAVEFLKIDAQGADLDVVRSCGGRLKDIERIELEVQITSIPLYSNSASKQDVIDFLWNAGFDLESSELQSMGQEENLRFVRTPFSDPGAALAQARPLTYARPLELYPGWHFGIDWNSADPLIAQRRLIWNYFHGRAMETPLEFAWYAGISLLLYMGNDISRSLYVEGCIDPNEFVFLDRFLKPGMVVVDAGANEGLYTIFAARKVAPEGAVFAFEPSAREFARLRNNVERNHISNVRALAMALGSIDSQAVLHVAMNEHAGQNTFGAFAYEGVKHVHDELVTVRSLDSFVQEARLTRLDLMKIDVEGAEPALIAGASESLRRFRPVLLFEVSDASLRHSASSAHELLQTIASLGYILYVIDPRSGLPKPASPSEFSDNMIAAPSERPLPAELCVDPSDSTGQAHAPRLRALPEDVAPFSLREYALCNSGEIVDAEPLRIRTSPEQWSYGALFRVLEPHLNSIVPALGFTIRAEVQVHVGCVAFGLVTPDLQTYISKEVAVQASESTVVFDIACSVLPPQSAFMIRNWNPNGVPSEVTLFSLTVLTPELNEE